MSKILHGNSRYSHSHHGWFVGHFQAGAACQTDVELKWGTHSKGTADRVPTANRSATSLTVLLSGRIEYEFDDGEETERLCLSEPGDFVLWPPKVAHTWVAINDSVALTVRWPSIPGDQYKASLPGDLQLGN